MFSDLVRAQNGKEFLRNDKLRQNDVKAAKISKDVFKKAAKQGSQTARPKKADKKPKFTSLTEQLMSESRNQTVRSVSKREVKVTEITT